MPCLFRNMLQCKEMSTRLPSNAIQLPEGKTYGECTISFC